MKTTFLSASACALFLTVSSAQSEDLQEEYLPLTENPAEFSTRWDMDNHQWEFGKHFTHRGHHHHSEELKNLLGFHMLDFVGWNNRDFDVFRHYHTDDVEVIGFGTNTIGIEAHVEWSEGFIAAAPSSYVLFHNPVIAQNDWTCVVGGAPGVGAVMATVAQWEYGAIYKEYLLGITDVEGAPEIDGEPIVYMENSGRFKAETGAEEGWSCVFGKTADGRYTASVSKDGEPDSTMAFVSQ